MKKDQSARYVLSGAQNASQDSGQRNRQADDAWEEYRASGQSVSHEEMDAWLATWGTDREGPCPIQSADPAA